MTWERTNPRSTTWRLQGTPYVVWKPCDKSTFRIMAYTKSGILGEISPARFRSLKAAQRRVEQCVAIGAKS